MTTSNLEELKALLQVRKEKLNAAIANANSDINAITNSSPVDDGDFAKINTEANLQSSIIAQNERELAEIERALAKFAEKKFGICEMCDEEIDLQRLTAKPHARYCFDCREIVEKERGGK